jgi:hypothetical protein
VFQKKETKIQHQLFPLSLPVAFFVDRDYPNEIKDKLVRILADYANQGYVIRINGDDPVFVQKVKDLACPRLEIYIPFKDFNQIETKHYFNHETAKEVAKSNFPSWDKVPDFIKSLFARNVRLLFGDKLNSPVLELFFWSEDGCESGFKITQKTGRISALIRLADRYKVTMHNIGNESTLKRFKLNNSEVDNHGYTEEAF